MIITIDTDIWATQKKYANELRIEVNVVTNWIKREKIEFIKYPELNLILVKRGSEHIREYISPKPKKKKK